MSKLINGFSYNSSNPEDMKANEMYSTISTSKIFYFNTFIYDL